MRMNLRQTLVRVKRMKPKRKRLSRQKLRLRKKMTLRQRMRKI